MMRTANHGAAPTPDGPCGTRYRAAVAWLALLMLASAPFPRAHAVCVFEAGAPSCDDNADPGSSEGSDPAGHHVGNPIDVISGNKYQAATDYRAFDSPLAFVRHYNATLVDHDVGLGRGWRHGFQAVLSRDADGRYRIVQGDGRTVVFGTDGERVGAGGNERFAARRGGDGFLDVAGEERAWQLPDGRRLAFRGPYLVRIDYPDGQRLMLRYRARRLDSITDARGSRLRLVYADGRSGLRRYGEDDRAPPGHLAELELPDGSTIGYRYDDALNLTGVVDSAGGRARYEYGDADWPNHLTALRHEDGRVLGRWRYDHLGRAVGWVAGDGSEAVRVEHLGDARIDAEGRTRVVHANGVTERFDWVASEEGTDARVVGRRVLAVDPPGDGWIVRAEDVPDSVSDDDAPGPTGETDVVATFPSTIDVPLDDGGSVPLTMHVDRLGNLRDVQLGEVRLTDLAAATRRRPAGERRARPAVESALPLGVRATRLLRYGSAVAPSSLEVDIETILELAVRAEERAAALAQGGLMPRARQFGEPGPVCPLPPRTSCEDIEHSRRMAELSACAYPGKACATTLQEVAPTSIGLRDEDFLIDETPALLYYDPVHDRYTLAFRGTAYSSDWDDNIRNGLGLSSGQYTKAAKLGRRLSRALERRSPDSELNFTGHSLGGGLATIAALKAESFATVFNSAGLHERTAAWNSLSLDDAGYLVENVRVEGEIVSTLQRRTGAMNALFDSLLGDRGRLLVGDAPGYHTVLPKPEQRWIDGIMAGQAASDADGDHEAESVILHGIDAVRESLDSMLELHCGSQP